jgi:UDP-N-acetylglucosamine/UDP-N-acetylgalactosamine 4-epimerase
MSSKYKQLQDNLLINQNTWLITGVAGFIGSNLLEMLLIHNQKVVGIDNFDTGFQHNIDQAIEDASIESGRSQIQVKKNFHFIQGDIRILGDCQKACKGIDYVLHQAALGSVPRSIEDPIYTNQANVDGFLNMLVAASEAKVERFVYAASSSTYGDHKDLPKVEDVIGNPLSPYAVTKLVNELYAGVFFKTYGLSSIGLRYFNIFGKRQDPNGAYAAVIPKWMNRITQGKSININGDGSTSRDFCYIDNAVQMNILAAISKDKNSENQIYNTALNENTSLNELYKIIEAQIKKQNIKIKKISPVYRPFRKGDVLHSQADISKAKKILGYSPSHNINEGLNEYVIWFLSHLN